MFSSNPVIRSTIGHEVNLYALMESSVQLNHGAMLAPNNGHRVSVLSYTSEEDENFDGLVVLLPTVSLLAVHGVAGVLPCIGPRAVD